jgi:putative nucleotidyltransferase with HDIG domain
MSQQKELKFFALRWFIVLISAFIFEFYHPYPYLIFTAAFAIYGILAAALLFIVSIPDLPFVFCLMDFFWIFSLCWTARAESIAADWLFIVPAFFMTLDSKTWKLMVSLLTISFFEIYLQIHPVVSSEPAPYFFIQLLITCIVLTAGYSLNQQHEAPFLEAADPESRKSNLSMVEHHRRIKQITGEKEETTTKLYDKIRQQSTLYEIMGHITNTLDVEKLFELTVVRSKEEFKAEASFLMLLQGEQIVVVHQNALLKPTEEAFISQIGEPPFGKVIQKGEPLVESLNMPNHPILDSLLLLKNIQMIRDLMVVPLKTPSGKVSGVLGVLNSFDRTGFTQEQMELLTVLAGQTAIALENAQMIEKQKTYFKETIEAFAAAINQKHHYTHVLHSKSVAKWASDIARKMSIPKEEIERIEIGAILHDVGKIAIPDLILTKEGKLTPEEVAIMQEHPNRGANMIKEISLFQEIAPFILHHHERWDGKGYPDKLSGEQIPLGSQIISVADTFDAMTANRPYHKGLNSAEALEIIKQESGKQFSPRVVEVFVKIMQERVDLKQFHLSLSDDKLSERRKEIESYY